MLKMRLVGFIIATVFVGAVMAMGIKIDLPKIELNGGEVTAANLRCEYKINPLGIDVAQPRLSWIVDSAKRGQKQTAYQVLAASTKENLAAEKGDLWDSGKVASDETVCVVYTGKPPVSNQDCFWKVRIWDKDGKPSGWSKPAHWSMGMLNEGDWKGQWIGYDVSPPSEIVPEEFQKAKWIWSADMKSKNAKPGKMYFRMAVELPKESKMKSAVCYIAADDLVKLFINGKSVGSHKGWQPAKTIDIKDQIQTGRNILAVAAANNGQSANPAGVIAAVVIEMQDGQKKIICTDGQWLASQKAQDQWMTPNYNDATWAKAEVIGDYGRQPWGQIKTMQTILPPARYLRSEFAVSKPVKRAYLYATALGIYQVYLNGRRISQDYFSPGWTDYDKRIYYRTYDVTSSLKKGNNAIGAILADGWYAGYVGHNHQRNHYGRNLRLLAQLLIEYTDGSTAVVFTNPDWKATLGPILEADFLMGETYDARKELTGWDKTGYNDLAWAKVNMGKEISPEVQAAVSEPVMAFGEIRPVSLSEPAAGNYVFNMGQNFAGFVRLKIHGKAGQAVRLRFAERLNPDGTIYTTNLRAARAADTYTCKGKGTETWQPMFTFHGFQYVEITGLDYKPGLDSIMGIALSSDTPVAGTFECSDPMINQLHSNVYWTQRMNFIDIPTDCPQRDERLGWTGDAQVYIGTAALNTDVHAFFTKWLQDMIDAQRADGQFPRVVPIKVAGDDGGPAWADAGVICPWTIYQVYGDRRLLERQYPSMVKFIEFCKNRSTPELLPPEKFHCFGDWLNINDDTPKEVIYTAYFALSTKLTAQAAEALGKTEDAKKFNELFDGIKQAFNKAYVSEDGKIKGDTQTAYVLAIAVDLVDGEKYQAAAKRLVELIEKRDWHLSTGFVGTKDLMLVLSKIGRNDVAYRLLHNDTFPSWGFSIKHGATSIWERWNGWTPEQGFGDPGMNSFAHYSFGAVYQWMVENIGGIRADEAAYKKIVIKPQPGGKLTWAKTSYDSIQGIIATGWKIEKDKLLLAVVIPANTTALVYIPASSVDAIKEGGKTIKDVEGVKYLRMESSDAVFEVASGMYRFTSRITE
jgi:alpha-L-rhamnosidase